MLLFICGILIAICGVIAAIITAYKPMKMVGAAASAFGVIVIVLSCFANVPTGHTGILTTFGRVENVTLDAGVHLKAPWQRLIKMDNRVQKCKSELSCFSSDIQEVTMRYTLNYQISKSNASDIYRGIGKNYSDITIEPNIKECVKIVTAKYTAEQLVACRDELALKIEELLEENLERYNIELISTSIEDIDFTDAFTNAVEQKQVAVQNKLKAETEQAQKTMEQRQNAERKIISANADAEVSKINAEASAEVAKIKAQSDFEVSKKKSDADEYAGQKEAAKNNAIKGAITKDLLDYYYIQQWDGKLPTTYTGSENVSTIVGVR